MKRIQILAMILAFSFAIAPKTNAATNWADYFTKDEASSIKKMVDKYIRGQIEDDSDKWEGVIGKDAVDDSIAKKKIYTGTIAASSSIADANIDEGGGDLEFWKKIAIREIDLSDNDLDVRFYSKADPNNEDANITGLKAIAGSNLWQSNNDYVVLADGYVWVNYGDHESGFDEEFNIGEYKIIVNY